MEKRFTVDEGQHSFKGSKFQEIIYPIIATLVCVGSFFLPFIPFMIACILAGVGVVVWLLYYIKMKDINVKVKFDKSCLYKLPEGYDQINKIWGLSIGGHHHKNSARFGWRAVGKKIEIHTYCYINGERVSEKLIDCLPNEWVELDLDIFKDSYQFKAKNADGERALKKIPRDSKGFLGLFTYKLFPYFGGKYAAPHKMGLSIIETEK